MWFCTGPNSGLDSCSTRLLRPTHVPHELLQVFAFNTPTCVHNTGSWHQPHYRLQLKSRTNDLKALYHIIDKNPSSTVPKANICSPIISKDRYCWHILPVKHDPQHNKCYQIDIKPIYSICGFVLGVLLSLIMKGFFWLSMLTLLDFHFQCFF